MSIRVLIVDDHPVIHFGLAGALNGSDIQVVANAYSVDEAIQKFTDSAPDVVLMDVRMPEADGLKALEHLKALDSGVKCVMFSAYDNPTYVARSIALGAHDFVLKSGNLDQLIAAIRGAHEGSQPGSESLFNQVKTTMRRRRESADESNPLTNREMQVLRHVALGLSNREIGKSLGISIETVKEHVQNILRKVNANDRTQAAVWAVRRGFV